MVSPGGPDAPLGHVCRTGLSFLLFGSSSLNLLFVAKANLELMAEHGWQAVALFFQPGLEDNLRFEHAHKAIFDRFGRYPHRNATPFWAAVPRQKSWRF